MASKTPSSSTQFISPRQLAQRWDCSRSTAQRIAKRAGLTRVPLGEGRNGMVRYPLAEVVAYEAARSVRQAPEPGARRP